MYSRPRNCKAWLPKEPFPNQKRSALSLAKRRGQNAGRLPAVAALNELAKRICNQLGVKPIEYFIFRLPAR